MCEFPSWPPAHTGSVETQMARRTLEKRFSEVSWLPERGQVYRRGYELVGMYTDEHHGCDAKYTYARSGCARVGVVGLVGRVADVAPEEGGLDLVPRRRGRVQALHGPLRAALEAAATATEDVADDVGTLKGGKN